MAADLLLAAESALTFTGAGVGRPVPVFKSTWCLAQAWQCPLAGVFAAQADKLIASADALAVADFGSGVDGAERHSKGVRMLRMAAKADC
jgi:hypothetical protein